MSLPLLYRDEQLVAIHKPAGMLVHRTRMSRDRQFVLQTLRDALGRHLWPVHRLDRATSGVLVFALDPNSARHLADQFRRRTADKHYLALVRGWIEAEGEIDHPVRVTSDGRRKDAVTRYRRLAQVELPVHVDRYPTSRYALAEVRPLTGRYQQIRQHFKHISHPIVGDTTWGDGKHNRLFRERYGIRRLMLHAWRLRLIHPASGRPLELTAPIDAQWQALFQALGWDGAAFTGPGEASAPPPP